MAEGETACKGGSQNGPVEDILPFVSPEVRAVLCRIDAVRLLSIEEIRLRVGKPMMVHDYSGDWFVETDGTLCRNAGKSVFCTGRGEVSRTLEMMSENSIYAYQDEIKNGFITIRGGHRVGICGRVVLEKDTVKNIRDIGGLCIRISREVPGCGAKLLRHIIRNPKDIYNTLIVSPPQCGKTTMLRDLARLLSDGNGDPFFKGVKVGIVDERSELAACFKGVPQNMVGLRTDVLDGCPKSIGMLLMLRSMSPQVIVTDEIGNDGDREAVMQVVNAGVRIITTAHGYNVSELKSRPGVIRLLQNRVFDRYAVLDAAGGPGNLVEIDDSSGMKVMTA